MKAFLFHIPKDMHMELKLKSFKEERHMKDIVLEALKEKLEREAKKG